MNWFGPSVSSTVQQHLLTILACVLVVAFAISHWPRRVGGPLTPRERANASTRNAAQRMIASLVTPAVGLGAAFLLLLLIVPLRCQRTFVLCSRTVPAGQCPAELGKVVGAYDLGSVVDGIVADCRGCDASPRGRIVLRERVMAALARDDAWSAPMTGAPARAVPRYMDTWTVETIELSVVALASRRFNTARVHVATIAREGVSPWSVAKQAFQLRELPIDVRYVDVDQVSELVVSRIIQARLSPGRKLSLWALVTGPAPLDTTITLTVHDVERGGPDEPVELRVPADDFGSRIVRLDRAPVAMPGTQLQVLAPGNGVKAPPAPVELETERKPLQLAFADPALADAWRGALARLADPQPVPGSTLASYRDELDAAQLQLPEVVAISELSVAVAPARTHVVIGTTAQLPAINSLVARVQWQELNQWMRIHDQTIAPSTVFSLSVLALRMADVPRLDDPAWRAAGCSVRPRAWAARFQDEIAKGHQPGPLQPAALGVECPILGRFVLISLVDLLATVEHAHVMPAARLLAWAATYVRDGDESLTAEPERERDELRRLATPVVTEADLQTALAAQRHGLDRLAIALTGLYLLLSLMRLARSARPA